MWFARSSFAERSIAAFVDTGSGGVRRPVRCDKIAPPRSDEPAEMIGILGLAEHGPVIPVVTLNRVDDAVPVAEALLAGGIGVVEVTLRTDVALAGIEAIARALPQMIVGAGTVLSALDARAAAAVGSRFAVSPGYRRHLGEACRELHLPLLPGVATPSEVMRARDDGHLLQKFFPALAAGGLPMLAALHGPFPEVAFCPTGGIGPDLAPSFLALPNVRLCGGSWLTPRDAIEARDWARITRLAQQARALRS